ncbi:MAG TPA: lipopolysaccharide biosynthesis protein [Mucilaginibacter sp.]
MDKIDKIEPDEISIRELMSKFKSVIRYVKSKWLILVWFGVSGILFGIIYSIFENPDYKAVSTFVLEESGHSGGLGLSQYSNIASLAGIDISGGSEKGLFQGDNIMELYKSRLMIEKTLLTPVLINDKKQLLVDRYIKSNDGCSIWNKKNKNVNFNKNYKMFSRYQDSIIRDIVKYFNKHILTVTKPDKKLSIISVEIKFKDEIFAQLFNQTLVQNVNDFYIQTQTRKTSQSVRVLQHQSDSVRNILNSSIGRVAASTDQNPNPNPTLHSLQVPYQKKQIDVQSNSAIYSELVKNLELEKLSLRQETPLIQLIDEPILPLEVDKTGKIEGALIGAIAGLFLGLVYLVAGRFYRFVKKS